MELGETVIEEKEVPENEVVQPLKKVQRVATPEDLRQAKENRVKSANHGEMPVPHSAPWLDMNW